MLIRRCTHLRANGKPCGSPALREHSLCFYHHQSQRRDHRRIRLGGPNACQLSFAPLEDGESIQVAIRDVMHAVIDGQIDRATAQTLLYSLQLAVSNLKNIEPAPLAPVTTELSDESEDDSFDRLPPTDQDQESPSDQRQEEADAQLFPDHMPPKRSRCADPISCPGAPEPDPLAAFKDFKYLKLRL